LSQIILLIAAAFIQTSVWAAEDAPVENKWLTLTIRAINGTAQGRPVVGDRVTVTIREHEKVVETLQGQLGIDGKVTFENVPAGEHLMAVAYVVHEGMKFIGHAFALNPKQEQITSQVNVFDVSYDNSILSAQTQHLIIEQKGDSLLFTEYIQLVNSSDLAVSSSKRDDQGRAMVLTIPLPKGFKNFNSSSYFVREALVFTQEGFYDTMAVPPGDHQIIFSYTLDVKSDMMDITKNFSLPTNSFVLFSQSALENIQGLGEPDGEVVLSDGTLANYFTRTDLPATAKISFKITGLSTSPATRTSWVILAIVFGAITILAIVRLRRVTKPS